MDLSDYKDILPFINYSEFAYICSFEKKDHGIYLPDFNIYIDSNDLLNHLADSTSLCIISGTVGEQASSEVRRLSDPIFNTMAEAYNLRKRLVDYLELSLNKSLVPFLGITRYQTARYSPGYGDLSIKVNYILYNILQKYLSKIGIIVQENGLIFPELSVIAFVGLQDKPVHMAYKSCVNCSECKDETCLFYIRKHGKKV